MAVTMDLDEVFKDTCLKRIQGYRRLTVKDGDHLVHRKTVKEMRQGPD